MNNNDILFFLFLSDRDKVWVNMTAIKVGQPLKGWMPSWAVARFTFFLKTTRSKPVLRGVRNSALDSILKALQIQGPTKNHESIKKSDAQLHPHWVNLGIIESLGHSKGIGGRTFQQNRSLVQAWGSWWLVIGRLYIELGSAAKFGWVLQWLPSPFCPKKTSDLRRMWWEENPLEHWHQLCWPCWAIFQMSKACGRMPCDKSTQMRGWGRVVPCQISSVLTLNHETNQNYKTYSRIEAYAKLLCKLLYFPPKGRLPKFGLGFPFFVHIDFHLEQATPGTTLWSFWGTVATTAWGGVSFGRREKDKECLEVLLIWKLES